MMILLYHVLNSHQLEYTYFYSTLTKRSRFCIQNTYGVNESKLPKILSYTISTYNEL